MKDVADDLAKVVRNSIEYIKTLELERQQALEALLMMRDRYGEYACPACDHADAAVYALKAALAEDALAEDALQRLTDVSQEIEAALAEQEQEPWEHLKHYGYAPGNYMSRCRICDKLAYGVDKRAITCRPCAEVRYAERQKAEPVQEPDPAGGGIAIKWHGAVLYLDGKEIDPGVVELRKDGYTFRSAVKVDVQPAQPLSRNIRRKALAQALRGMADGFEQKTYWFRPDPLVMSTLRRAADELDKENT
jgi:hypothetical protein